MSTLDLDFVVRRGAFELAVATNVALTGVTAVFGPSGCGKTTLLRAVAGLEPPTRGRIACSGVTWDDGTRHVPAHARHIGYVFQDGRLFPHLSVAGNLDFAIHHARSAGPISRRDVVAALDLEMLLERRPQSLSGGEQQRAAIARALVTNPRLLLMDEPLASLDASRRSEIAGYIEQLPERFGLPILYVTHDIDEVIRLAETMVLLSGGTVAAHGPIADILERIDLWPLTGRLEAGSLLSATVVEHAAGMTTLRIDGQTLSIPEIAVAAGRRVRLRIPARDVVIATARPANLSIRNVLSARVASIDLDATVYAEILLDLDGQRLRARITRAALADLGLVVGAHAWALVKSVAVDAALLR